MDRKEKVKQDITLVRQYRNKVNDSSKRGIPFLLTYAEYKRLMTRKTCYFTGVVLTEQVADSSHPAPTARTLDRIDANIGYIPENTVACCHAANQAKSFFEKNEHINMQHLKRMLHKL